MKVVIKYDDSSDEFILYNKDLDVAVKSREMFKVLVLFNSFITEKLGESVNILSSDQIEYTLDSKSMKQMIQSNVNLLKKLGTPPSEFQLSSEKFGESSSNKSGFFSKSFKSKVQESSIKEYDRMVKKSNRKKLH